MNALRPYLKAVLPALGTAAAVAVQWIATGEFDRAELATALTGGFSALVAFAAKNAPAYNEYGDPISRPRANRRRRQ